MDRLRRLDPVAYILFASVYKDFQSLEDFQSDLQRLMCDLEHPDATHSESSSESHSATSAGATGAALDSVSEPPKCFDQKEPA
jgi:hypothetical protein